MSHFPSEQVLLIGDADRAVQSALAQALPTASVTSVPNYFDGIAELAAQRFTAVLAAAEPIERRPEAAVHTLRQLAGDGRIILFGQPSLEPVSRKMLSFGCDDYVVTPATPGELGQIFGAPPLRLATTAPAHDDGPLLAAAPPSRVSILAGLPLAEIVLDAILQNPHGGPAAAVKQINARIAPAMQLAYVKEGAEPPPTPEGSVALSHAVRVGSAAPASLHLALPRDEEQSAARHFLAQLAHVVAKVAALEDRHVRLQKLAITDDLTGLYNGRYFRHFLTAILQKAHAMRFPVTLLLFDIDGFKTYNDQFGHGVGDEILRQTSALMKRVVRDHDLVARLGGDEFAVVFWEKEGPRQPRDAAGRGVPIPSSRIPQTPIQIFERFKRLLAGPEFNILGSSGKGQLTISGAMAVYPYDAQDVNGLIDAADRELMFNAKASGKNCLRLVGQDPDDNAPPR
ncbi:MAG TPA: GGDEF domain-containing protein [Tepidisphaeraceae bacterium]|nr:GGDEF domain-containing protein [Tepidisphaeraceae bacterium]